MSLLPLHLLGSPVLRQRSKEVSVVDEEVRRFVEDLFETMHAAKGVGLAANQVGVARRIAVVETEEERRVCEEAQARREQRLRRRIVAED